jgi:hypothetical protein
MKTVLLWGPMWWVENTAEPLPFAGIAQAADVLAAHFPDPKPRLRLIYQPDSLETIPARCPNARRSTLGAALAGEIPSLADDACAWSHEPILPCGDEWETILHFEHEPGALGTLIVQLEEHGFVIESVWPLGTFLHAVPTEWTESGATTILALHEERACAYRHGTDGRRAILFWRGERTVAEVAEWLQGIYAQNADEPVTFLIEDPDAEALDALVPYLDKKTKTLLPIPAALQDCVLLPRHHPAQLLSPPPLITAQRVVVAASIVFFAFATWSGANYARDCAAWRTEGEARETQKRELRTEVAQRRASAAEIAALRTSLAGESAGPPCGELLRQLAATVPPEVALTSLRISTDRFSLHGYVAPNAPASAVDGWLARLSTGKKPVQLPTLTPPAVDGMFAVSGRFQP